MPCPKHLPAGLGYHGPVVNAKSGKETRHGIWELRVENHSIGEKKKKPTQGKGLHLSSVAKSRAPRSWHMVSIISCSLKLPMRREG